MKFKDLQYLVAVAHHQHFGKAAEACFVSQPALSMQIQKLEESLGVTLLERTNKSVQLTDVGQSIVLRAQHILAEAEALKEVANAAKDPLSGDCRLGIFPTLAPYLLPLIMPALNQALPQMNFYLIEEKTNVLIEQLKSGQLHAALLASPVHEPNFSHTPLFDEDFYLAVPKKHRFSALKKVKPEQLDEETLLLLDEGHCLRDQALAVCHRMKAHENQHFRATSLETLRHMVGAGLGITLMPKLACTASHQVCYLPFSQAAPTRRIALYSRANSAKAVALKKIGTLIRQTIKHPQG